MNRSVILLFLSGLLYCKAAELPKYTPETPPLKETITKRPLSNNIFYNHSRDGLNIRLSATTNSEKIGVLPYKAKVTILDKAYDGGLVDSESLWYSIKFQVVQGWVSGRFLSTLPPDTDYADFKGGCLRDSCDGCDSVVFNPDHKFQAAIGCHYGWGKGTWWTKPDGIYAKITYVPSCYDSCRQATKSSPSVSYEAASKAYQLKYTHSVELRFFQTQSGALDFDIISSSLPDEAKYDLPKKPLTSMRPYERSP